ncbi:MAG TPA: hypothetical protein VGY57_16740, partial [Vicinamibacterales bacterium]|nr:hypothetical protein [Vicinamibacterales bacterium]
MLSFLCAAAVAASLASDLQEIAKLSGEPSIVSAAGLTASGDPVLTLENPSAFDPQSTRRRVVIYAGGGSELTAATVLKMVRWFKTAAPADLRDRWLVSALPSVDFDPADRKSFDRWCTFQAPDIAIEVTDGDAHPIGFGASAQPWVSRLPLTDDQIASTLMTMLRSRLSIPASAHETIAARVARDPLTIAKLLAAKYPGEPSISYIPALSWSNALKLAAMTNDAALRAKVEQQIQPWRSGQKDLFGNRIQLTSVAGTLVFADLARTGDQASAPLAIQGANAAGRVKADDTYEYGGGWTDDMFMAS